MLKNEFYISSPYGGYTIGVNSKEELVFVCVGDSSVLQGIGYPSLLGDWYETTTEQYVWSLDNMDVIEAIECVQWLNEMELPEILDKDGKDCSIIVRTYISQVVRPGLHYIIKGE